MFLISTKTNILPIVEGLQRINKQIYTNTNRFLHNHGSWWKVKCTFIISLLHKVQFRLDVHWYTYYICSLAGGINTLIVSQVSFLISQTWKSFPQKIIGRSESLYQIRSKYSTIYRANSNLSKQTNPWFTTLLKKYTQLENLFSIIASQKENLSLELIFLHK